MKKQYRISAFLLAALLVAACAALIVPAEEAPAAPEANAPVILYEENFETIATVGGYADLGWTESFNGSRVTVALDQETDGNTRLKVSDAGWSSLRFVSKEKMTNVASYTVSLDLTISKLKFWGVIYNNAVDGNNQQNTGLIQFRTEGGVHYLANAGKRNNGYFCASYTGDGARNDWNGQWAPAENFLNGDKLLGTEFKLTMTVDMAAKTCSVFINDVLVNTCENTQVNVNGIDFLFQNQECYMDNIKVTAVMAAEDEEESSSSEETSSEAPSEESSVEESSEAATTQKPAATTSAPTQESAPATSEPVTNEVASNDAKDEKGGCASVLGGALGLMLTVGLAASAVLIKEK